MIKLRGVTNEKGDYNIVFNNINWSIRIRDSNFLQNARCKRNYTNNSSKIERNKKGKRALFVSFQYITKILNLSYKTSESIAKYILVV